jgi:hypothetical protein
VITEQVVPQCGAVDKVMITLSKSRFIGNTVKIKNNLELKKERAGKK